MMSVFLMTLSSPLGILAPGDDTYEVVEESALLFIKQNKRNSLKMLSAAASHCCTTKCADEAVKLGSEFPFFFYFLIIQKFLSFFHYAVQGYKG